MKSQSSNKSFGLLFFVVFLILGLWPLKNGESLNFYFITASVVFLILGLLNSKLLTPFNKIWFKFGIFLGGIIAPITMGVVFFFVVTPVGFIMRILGKDLLNIKYNSKKDSYWIKRDKPIDTMKRQF